MKILYSKLSMSAVILGLVILTIFFFTREDTSPKDAIDLKLGIIKAPDTVNTVEIAHKETIQIRFSWEVGGIVYNDALNLSKEAYEKLTPDDIERMKNERFQNWVKVVNEGSRE